MINDLLKIITPVIAAYLVRTHADGVYNSKTFSAFVGYCRGAQANAKVTSTNANSIEILGKACWEANKKEIGIIVCSYLFSAGSSKALLGGKVTHNTFLFGAALVASQQYYDRNEKSTVDKALDASATKTTNFLGQAASWLGL